MNNKKLLSPSRLSSRTRQSETTHLHFTQEDALALVEAANEIALLVRKAQDAAYVGRAAFPARMSLYAERPEPAVPPDQSVTHEYIVCLEDGACVKSLKSHLRHFGLTPDQYRHRWGLPADYPMVAPALSEKRAAIARAVKPHLSRKMLKD